MRVSGFVKRLIEWLHQILVSLNQLAQVIISGPKYVIYGGRMTADETISSKVGRMSFAGKRWAIVAEWLLDRLFWLYEGERLGHCFRAIENQ